LKDFVISRAAFALLLGAITFFVPAALRAQAPPGLTDPAATLADVFQSSCRQDQESFAKQLTAENAAAFRKLPSPQRTALLKRFVLLEDRGTPLLSTDEQGRTVLRCEAAGAVAEIRFGAVQAHDNLAFISVEIPQAGQEAQSGRFGLVREDGQWKLLSLGLLLLDVPALARQWEQADFEARELAAAQSLRTIAEALEKYRQAFGHLPEMLEQLGPAGQEGNSPEKAGLLNAALATGEDAGYRFRYTIVPSKQGADESDREKNASFRLAATPVEYGKGGRRSFYLDGSGTLRGADKAGAVATVSDPAVRESQR
jgi:hypothetical protein